MFVRKKEYERLKAENVLLREEVKDKNSMISSLQFNLSSMERKHAEIDEAIESNKDLSASEALVELHKQLDRYGISFSYEVRLRVVPDMGKKIEIAITWHFKIFDGNGVSIVSTPDLSAAIAGGAKYAKDAKKRKTNVDTWPCDFGDRGK